MHLDNHQGPDAETIREPIAEICIPFSRGSAADEIRARVTRGGAAKAEVVKRHTDVRSWRIGYLQQSF